MDVLKFEKDKEVRHLQWRLKRTIELSHAMLDYSEEIHSIKRDISDGIVKYAAGQFMDLPIKVQDLLLTAWSKGGPFDSYERQLLTDLCKISVEQMERDK